MTGKPLPSVFVIGVQKCGTTTLAAWLSGHKDLLEPTPLPSEPTYYHKELHFFDGINGNGDIDFYNAHFTTPLPNTWSHYFEATPSYFYDQDGAIQKMASSYGPVAFKKLKFLLIVRDPVDRTVSWWNHFAGLEFKNFENFTTFLVSNLNMKLGSLPEYTHGNPCRRQGECYNRLYYGVYSKWLKSLLAAGVSAGQIEVLFLNEFVNEHDTTSVRITEFLEIPLYPPEADSSDTVKNVHKHEYQLSGVLKAQLREWYLPFNCEFAKLLNSSHMRSWGDMQQASSGWIPSPKECVL